MMPIVTLQNLLEYNNALFDDIDLPYGAVKEQLVDALMFNYGEMQVLYPDWPVMQAAIRSWFRAHAQQLQHLWNDYIAEYNPVYNKDGYVEELRTPNLQYTDQRESKGNTGTQSSGSRTGSGTSKESGSTTAAYQGFQSTGFNDVSKETPDITNTGSNSESTLGRTDSDSLGSEASLRTERGSESVTRHEYGNIGVTMASQMLRDDSMFWRSFSWYSIAAKLWAVDNLVMVY